MQVEKLSARMGHTADFGDAQLEASLIAGEVIADQLAVPGAHEVGWVFTGTAGMTAKNQCEEAAYGILLTAPPPVAVPAKQLTASGSPVAKTRLAVGLPGGE